MSGFENHTSEKVAENTVDEGVKLEVVGTDETVSREVRKAVAKAKYTAGVQQVTRFVERLDLVIRGLIRHRPCFINGLDVGYGGILNTNGFLSSLILMTQENLPEQFRASFTFLLHVPDSYEPIYHDEIIPVFAVAATDFMRRSSDFRVTWSRELIRIVRKAYIPAKDAFDFSFVYRNMDGYCVRNSGRLTEREYCGITVKPFGDYTTFPSTPKYGIGISWVSVDAEACSGSLSEPSFPPLVSEYEGGDNSLTGMTFAEVFERVEATPMSVLATPAEPYTECINAIMLSALAADYVVCSASNTIPVGRPWSLENIQSGTYAPDLDSWMETTALGLRTHDPLIAVVATNIGRFVGPLYPQLAKNLDHCINDATWAIAAYKIEAAKVPSVSEVATKPSLAAS